MVLSSSEISEAESAQPTATVVVFAGGDAPNAADLARLPAAGTIIAADSGADHADGCGRSADVIVGDLDSISASGLALARARGTLIEPSPPDKDESDLELALLRALSLRPKRIVVTALSGGRVDHLLANLLLLCASRLSGVEVDGYSSSTRFFVVRTLRTLDVEPGQRVTLLPMHGTAHGVSTTGLQYPLDGEALEAGSPRGLSNVAIASRITVEVADGVVLAIMAPEDAP